MALVPRAALAQDIDAKIKRLEKMEARIDAKLKKLEAMEARLEVRLQPVAAQSRAGVEPSQDGLKHPSVTLRRATARSSGPAHDEKGLFGGQVSFKGGYSHMDSNTGNVLSAGGGQDGFLAGGALGIPFLKDTWFNNTLIRPDIGGFQWFQCQDIRCRRWSYARGNVVSQDRNITEVPDRVLGEHSPLDYPYGTRFCSKQPAFGRSHLSHCWWDHRCWN